MAGNAEEEDRLAVYAATTEGARTRFTAQDWERFFAALDEPAKPTDRMVNAVRKYRDIGGG
ncbi:DUF1778 domain-containing protein [Rhizobium leguminosarum]|uniref:type II toxin -antitoxin system TacA 1-like antitoxin n=1 Tax=Rhizobium leguminosarum TaxID=384 RepID=UPI001C9569F2|nr:DUF1778 domain-containing protein [Rhizobium leguminosarum]MBY5815746.1 DUF1778 domain-containing protein [Rhizobium leguminosarum]